MKLKQVYILRYDDELDHEQIGIFDSKKLMSKALRVVLEDHLDVDFDDPTSVSDILDYFSLETDYILSTNDEKDLEDSKLYTVYEYSSSSYEFISTFAINPNMSDGYEVVQSKRSKLNEIDFKGLGF